MKKETKRTDEWSQIRGHLFLASREMLLAAKGVIKCFQNEGIVKNSPKLDAALKQATKVAEDFSRGIVKTSSFADLAKDMLVPIIRSTSSPDNNKKRSAKRRKK